MSEKPIHVQVAEALGCEVTDRGDGLMLCGCDGKAHGQDEPDEHGDRYPLKHYDTDWSATGPLLVEYEISLECDTGDSWTATADFHVPTGQPHDEPYGGAWRLFGGDGETPLLAVCRLFLAAKEAGWP